MNKKVTVIGVDVSKEKLDICLATGIENADGRTLQVQNNIVGVNKLLKKLNKENCSKETPIIVESTGDYHILLCILLSEDDWNVCLINPLITKQFARANVRKCKNDKVDAFLLARIGLLQTESLYKFQLSRNDVITKKKLSTLDTFAKKHQGLKRSLKTLQETSSNLEVEESEGVQALEIALKALATAMRKLEEEIVKEYSNTKDVNRIAEISGVSTKAASKILIHLEGKIFATKKQLTAFTGLDVSVRQSGTSLNAKGRISKRGNPNLRKVLFQSAWGLTMHNEQFKKLYDYHKAQGKHHYTCLIILARKLLHVIFGMLENGTQFNPTLITIPNN